MITNLLDRGLVVGVLVLGVSLMLGCTTVVAPISHEDITIADADHGFLFGHIHLTRNGKDRPTGLKWPIDMKWWLEEETLGKRFLIAHLPIDGSFVVKLPAGNYRLTDVSFDSVRGIWHTALPATFSIRSRECTSLGTWKLQMRTGFFSGWITRQVSHKHGLAQDGPGSILGAKGCPILVASLESPVSHSVRLNFHTRGSGRF